jgi:hypothetical protein
MKISELNEGFFSDLAYKWQDTRDPEKEQERVLANAKPAFIKDFIEDFKADFESNKQAGTFSKDNQQPVSTTQGFNDSDKLEKARPYIQRMIARNQINNKTELASFLAKKYPNIWNNTKNKTAALDALFVQPTTESIDYINFGFLIESIIVEQTPGTVANWITRWFAAYMQGTNWKSVQNNVVQVANTILTQDNKIDSKAVEELANLAWAVVSSERKAPYGASDVEELRFDTYTGDKDKHHERMQKLLTQLIQQDPEKAKKMIEKAQADSQNK